MEDHYYLNYFNSISDGLKSTKYYTDKKSVQPNVFFNTINELIIKLKNSNHKIYFFGNGASAAFANHMALDFSKNGKILARSLSDSALLTALANDYSFESAMTEFLKIEGVSKEDLVVTISSSGNSPNIINVLKYCNESSINTLALTGLKPDNKSIEFADYSIYVPLKTYGMVECIHQIFLHLILDNSMNIIEWTRNDFQNMNAVNFKL